MNELSVISWLQLSDWNATEDEVISRSCCWCCHLLTDKIIPSSVFSSKPWLLLLNSCLLSCFVFGRILSLFWWCCLYC